MGKVMPKYDLPKPGSRKPRKSQAKHTQIISGVARPETSMGKVIIMRPVEPKATAQAPKQMADKATVTQAPRLIVPAVVNPVIPKLAQAQVEAPKAVAKVAKAPVKTAPVAKPAPIAVKATAPAAQPKGHASAGMVKAAGPQELKTIEVNAAPLRAERFVGKGAGSQVASNQATAGMTKPAY
jgi:ribonuclease E